MKWCSMGGPYPALSTGSRRRPLGGAVGVWRTAFLRLMAPRASALEQLVGDLPDLDLLAALGDAVAAVVAVDVLEGHVARVAHPSACLHRSVGRLAGEPV